MNTHFTISLIGALQGLILSVAFFRKRQKGIANLMMAQYVGVFSAGLLESWLAEKANSFSAGLLLHFVSTASFLYGPLLYLFVYYLTATGNRFQRKHLFHFVPFGLFFIAGLVFSHASLPISESGYAVLELAGFEILAVQMLAYNIMAVRRLHLHHKQVLSEYAAIESVDLTWLKSLLLLITGIYLLSFTLSHLQLFGVEVKQFFSVVQLAIALTIYLMSYLVMARPALFDMTRNMPPAETPAFVLHEEPLVASAVVEATEQRVKYKNSGLRKEQSEAYAEELKLLMKKDRPFLDPDINLNMLAQLSGISKNHLTQVLNEEFGMNFYEFINRYRIEHAKRLLTDPAHAHLSIEGIAAQAGYKSKTTFFTHFKRSTGATPQVWLKEQPAGGG